MSCMLRIAGSDLDIDALLSECEIEAVSVFHKGEPRFPASQPTGRLHARSGANFEVSGAAFSELQIQIEDALAFLRDNESFVRRLRSCPGVEDVGLDFGSNIRPPGWCTFSFPPELLLAAGALGVSLDLSVYPVSDDEDEVSREDDANP